MSLLKQIKDDQLRARQERDSIKTSLLTTLIGEAQTKQINAQRDLTDTEVCALIKKFVDGVNDTINLRPSPDLDRELKILESYLPTMMSDSELESEIDAIIATVENPTGKSLGVVIKQLKANFEGLYDGQQATNLIRAKLG